MIEDYRIKTFLEVARQGNFTRAAEVLSLTQPAVTLQIKSLEQELGASLFDRSGQKITLSEAGRLLLPHAEAVHKIAEQARDEIATLGGEHTGQLTIGASTSIAQYVVPQLVGRFAQKHKKVQFKLLSGNTEQIADMVEAEEVDLGLVEGVVTRRNIKLELLCEDEIVLIVPVDDSWHGAANDVWTLEQLKSAPLILREAGSGTRSTIERALKDAGVSLAELNILMEMDSTEAIKAAVASGLGVSLVSQTAIAKELQLQLLATAPMDIGAIKRSFQFVLPRDKQLSAMSMAFKRFAMAH